ncbi:MAG: DUF1501 domain-containing protein [Planctomycetaceae bacterium]|nr:DUF1501 domain-containing protein [Planctomycetaceae bacterium]MCA9110036.1 DUF1501 domain-containing protein [Planctomycetaceae bacterium]
MSNPSSNPKIEPKQNARLAMSRRTLLRLGALGGMGLSLPQLLRADTEVASDPFDAMPSFGRAKRCLLVFLNGGPSQLDFWDMKPEAPAEIRGELRPIPTNVAGIQIGELLPRMAQQMDKFKIVRSVTHPCSVHTTGVYTMLTGTVHRTPNVDQTQALPEDHPHLGAIYARSKGWSNHVPPFVTLPTLFRAPPVTGIWSGQNAGFLGRRYDPFVVHGDKQTATFTMPTIDLPQHMGDRRLEDRRSLLAQFDQQFAKTDQLAEWDNLDVTYEQAYQLLRSRNVAQATDLHRESERTRDAYGRHLFGQGLLLARRFLEANVPLVTVYWIDPEPPGPGGGEFDSHGRIYHHLRERLAAPTDRALAAMIADLSERGMLDDTLVVVMSEFGRSPRINADAGRDHWPQVQSILLAGVGISGGTIYGASDRHAAEVLSDPITPPDLAQTILHLLGVPSHSAWPDQSGRIIRASHGTPVEGLFA